MFRRGKHHVRLEYACHGNSLSPPSSSAEPDHFLILMLAMKGEETIVKLIDTIAFSNLLNQNEETGRNSPRRECGA